MVDVNDGRYEEQGQLQLLDRDDADEKKDCLEAIERLIAQGINAGDIKKLEDEGIYTCNEFTMHVKKILTEMEGLSEAKVERTCEAAETIVHLRYITGSDFLLKSSDVQITTGWQTLDELHGVIAQGINAGDIKKLKDAGIYTCNRCMMHLKKILTGIEGLSEAKVEKICETAEKIVQLGYITGSDVLVKVAPYLLRPVNGNSSDVQITTGWQTLAELLGRGIQTFSITEPFGEFRSGKTQLAHTLCVSTQLSVYMDGDIDTEGTFRPDPIFTIAERFGMDVSAVFTHGTVGGLVGDAMIPIFGPNLHLFNLGAETLMGLPDWGFVFYLGTFAAAEFEGDIGAGFAIGLFPGLDMHQVPVPVPQEVLYLIALLTGLIRLIEYAIGVGHFPLSILTPEEEIGNSLLGGPDLPNEDAAGLLNEARNLLHGRNWTVKVGAFPIQHVCAEQAAIDAWPP